MKINDITIPRDFQEVRDRFKQVNDLLSGGELFQPQSYTPEFSCNGAMTFSVTAVRYATYLKLGSLLWVGVNVIGTVGGTPNTTILCTLPPMVILPFGTAVQMVSGAVVDNGALISAVTYGQMSKMNISRYDSANFTAGVVVVIFNGFLQVEP